MTDEVPGAVVDVAAVEVERIDADGVAPGVGVGGSDFFVFRVRGNGYSSGSSSSLFAKQLAKVFSVSMETKSTYGSFHAM